MIIFLKSFREATRLMLRRTIYGGMKHRLTKKLIGFEWSNQPYMANGSKHRLSLPEKDR